MPLVGHEDEQEYALLLAVDLLNRVVAPNSCFCLEHRWLNNTNNRSNFNRDAD